MVERTDLKKELVFGGRIGGRIASGMQLRMKTEEAYFSFLPRNKKNWSERRRY